MRKLTSAAAAVLLLTGCGTSTHGHPTTPTHDPGAARYAYLTTMRHYYPHATDTALMTLGRDICYDFDHGATWPQTVKAAVDSGVPAETAGAGIAAAVAALCPRNMDALP